MLCYIHIPFCDSKCHYCSFNSYVDRFETRERYMQALLRQLEFELQRFEANPGSIDTLFIGGGTPSTVSWELYAPLFEILDPWLSPNAEVSTEANPNSASGKWLEGMRSLGVNRISFGVQSFDEGKLRALGRAHSPRQAIEAVERAASCGFQRISLDLIYNYRSDDREGMERDIRTAAQLPIEHLSAYELTIEKGTLFSRTPEARQENDELARFVSRRIEEEGFPSYEISNFGEPCRHNLGYWRLEDYIGLGTGAVGFRKDRRFYPPDSIDAYLENPTAHRVEELRHEDLKTERLFLGLRSVVGIDPSWLSPSEERRALVLLEEGKLLEDNGRYFNPDFFLADELTLFLLD